MSVWLVSGSDLVITDFKYFTLLFWISYSVSTHGLVLSFCLNTLCTYSLTLYSELLTFFCINLTWFNYCILITNYYYMYCCSDVFCTVYVVIYWQVPYPLWWIVGILNKWMNEWMNSHYTVFWVLSSLLTGKVEDTNIQGRFLVIYVSYHKIIRILI